MEKTNQIKLVGAHVITIVLWASAFPAIRAALEAYQPGHLSLLRLLIGSIILGIAAWIMRIPLPQIRDVPVILLLGLMGFSVYHTALNLGEQTVEAAPASLLVTTTPIFAAILAVSFSFEKMRPVQWIGTAVSFSGMVVLTITGEAGGFAFNKGVVIILVAALSESVYFVFQKSYLQKYGVIPFTMYTIWAGTLFMLFFGPGVLQAVKSAPVSDTLVVVYLGIFPTVLPYFTLAYITMRAGAAEATSSLYITPLLSFIIAWIWLGETPTWFTSAGGVIILAGVYIYHLHFHKKKDYSNYDKINII